MSVRLTDTGSEGDTSNSTPEDWTDFNGAGCNACGYDGEAKDSEPHPANTPDFWGKGPGR